MTTLSVYHRDGAFYVIFPDDKSLPILMDGKPVTSFNPGWLPVLLIDQLSPIFLLELKHEDGREATWFLDAAMNRLGDSLSKLSPEVTATIRSLATEIISGLWRALIICVESALDVRAKEFFKLNKETRRQILSLCLPHMNMNPVILNLQTIPQGGSSLSIENEDHQHTTLDISVLNQIIDSDTNVRVMAAIRSGAMVWPSPSDGRPIACDVSITTDAAQRFAYRVTDRDHGLVFYVLVLHDHCMTCGIYFPSAQVIYTTSDHKKGFIESHFPSGTEGQLDVQWLRLLCNHGELIESYLNSPNRQLSMAVRGRFGTHIGVYIWGILTGVEKAARQLQGTTGFEMAVLSGGDSEEKFGAIDELFPELKGRVKRILGDTEALLIYAFTARRCLVQVSDIRVARRIGRQIVKINEAGQDAAQYRREFYPIAARVCPIIMLGLRVENRTLTDLAGFCIRMIEFLLEQTGEVAVVIDGHNAARHDVAKVYASDYQEFAARSPAEIEQSVVAVLLDRFRGRLAHIVSTIAKPLSASIFWGARANFFITMWGAGLAKYRWICNKPGLVITSRWNLRHRGDLRIYDQPKFFEGDPSMNFLPEQYVDDDPSAPLLFPKTNFPPESIWNFKVDEDAIFKCVRDLLAQYPTQLGSVRDM